MIKQRKILKITNTNNNKLISDDMIVEKIYTLIANDSFLMNFICLDQNIKELTIGHLVDKMLLNDVSNITSFNISNTIISITFNQCYFVSQNFQKKDFDLTWTNEIMQTFNDSSILFNKTGAIHSYAVYDKTTQIVTMEDTGRHNALDKVIGYCFLNEIPLHNKVIVTSGRITLEMAKKLQQHPISAIISISAPSLNAVELLEKKGITVIGFARNNGFNVYTRLESYIKSI